MSAHSDPIEQTPLRFRGPIQAYAHAIRGDSRFKEEDEVAAVVQLAESFSRQGVARWEEVSPFHHETYLRSIDPVIYDAKRPETAQSVKKAKTAARFMDYLVAKEILPESPAWRINMNKHGVIIKYDETHPEFDGPIEEFCSKRRNGRAPQFYRGHLKSLAGHLLTQDIRFLKDVTPSHMEDFARSRTKRAVFRGRSRIGTQSAIIATQAFFDYTKKRGLTASNPAEGLYATGNGRILTQRDVPKLMANALTKYDKEVLANEGVTSRPGSRSFLKAMMLDLCSTHGVRSWAEVKPAHYEDFLKKIWGRSLKNPELAQLTHAVCSRFLEKQLAKSPAIGFKVSLNGTMISPLHRKPLQMEKSTFPPQTPGWNGIQGVQPGFRKEANTYWKNSLQAGNVGNRKRIEMVMRDFSSFVSERGVENWTGVEPKHVSEYGHDLMARKGAVTAHPQFSIVRTFMADLESQSIRQDDPTIGFRLTLHSGFVEPPTINSGLVKQTDKALWEMHPTGDEWRSRKAYRTALQPLMSKMTDADIESWKDLPREMLHEYANQIGGDRNNRCPAVEEKATLRAFCSHYYGENPTSPAWGMLPSKGKVAKRIYGHMLYPGEGAEETDLSITPIAPPAYDCGLIIKPRRGKEVKDEY